MWDRRAPDDREGNHVRTTPKMTPTNNLPGKDSHDLQVSQHSR